MYIWEYVIIGFFFMGSKGCSVYGKWTLKDNLYSVYYDRVLKGLMYVYMFCNFSFSFYE